MALRGCQQLVRLTLNAFMCYEMRAAIGGLNRPSSRSLSFTACVERCDNVSE